LKYAISLLGMLLLVICGTLFIQYQVFSDKLEVGEGKFTYTQEIEITYRSGGLDIRQHFHNLPNQSIKITWPNLAVNTDCFLESETSCERLSDEKTEFIPAENRNASLSYMIPLDGGLKSNQLLKDIFVTLKNGQVSYSTVHISTDSEVQGQWVTGLPLIGNQSLSLVNYSMFEGTGGISEIYWQKDVMNLQATTDALSIFSNTPISRELSEYLKNLKLLNEDPIIIIQGKNNSSEQGKRILFLDDLSITSLNEKVILSQIHLQYDFGESPQWMSEVMASFLTDSTLGSYKSSEIVKTLKNKMSEAQMASWIEKLDDLKGKKISAKQLDDLLSQVLGNDTEYFTMNAQTEQVFPFLFNDKRKVFVQDEFREDVKVVLKDGDVLYSLDPILRHLGYQTSIGENGYYVQSETQKFRFPQGYGFYVYNNQRYNTVSEPLTVIADSFYIEETWLQRLFNLDIEKSEDTITIK